MRILYYFLDIDTLMYQWQRFHIVDELAMHNCEIEIISPLNYENIDEANERLIKKINTGKYDLFLTCLNHEYIYIDTIKQIRKLGIPTLLFCPDNLVAPYNHKLVAPEFDLVWLTSKETEYLFKKWGCNTIFLPYAANPEFLKPSYGGREKLRVGFIGTPHGSRIERINTLLAGGIPVTLHTNNNNIDSRFIKASMNAYFNKMCNYIKYPIGRKLGVAAAINKLWHRELVDEFHCLEREAIVPLSELAKVNGSYALVLCFTDADSTGILKKPVNIVNLRNFEVPMSGGIQFTTYTDEIASYFEDGKEIILCRSIEEYIAKAQFYLKEEQKEVRQKIRENARRRAQNEHTWYKRFSCIFDALSLKNDER